MIFNSFFNYFYCPRRCAYTILEVFTIFLSTVLHGNFYRFYGFCHENKVWYWVLFVIPPLPVRIETATLASHPSADRNPGTLTNRVRNSPRQHHQLDGYCYVLYTVYKVYSRPEIVMEFLPQVGIEPQPPWTCLPEAWITGGCHIKISQHLICTQLEWGGNTARFFPAPT